MMKEGRLRDRLTDVFRGDRAQIEAVLRQVDREKLVTILSTGIEVDTSLSRGQRKKAKRRHLSQTKHAILALLKTDQSQAKKPIADAVIATILNNQDQIAEPIEKSFPDSLIIKGLVADLRIPQDQRKMLLAIDGCPDELHDLVGILKGLIKKYEISGSESEQYYLAWCLHRLLFNFRVTHSVLASKSKPVSIPAAFEGLASDQVVEMFPSDVRNHLALVAKIDGGKVETQDVIALLISSVDSAQRAVIESLTGTAEEAVKFVEDLSLVIITLYGQDNLTDDGRVHIDSRSEAYLLAWQVRWLQRDHRNSINSTPVARGKSEVEPLRITPVDLMPPPVHINSGEHLVAASQVPAAATPTPRLVPAVKGVSRKPPTRSLWSALALLAVSAIAGKPQENYATTTTHAVMVNNTQIQGNRDDNKSSLLLDRGDRRIVRSRSERDASLEQCSVQDFPDRPEEHFYLSNALPSGINQCIQGGAQNVLQNAFGIHDAHVLQVVGSLAERAIRNARPSAVHTNQGDQVALAYNQSTGQWTVRQDRGGRPLVVAHFSYPLSTATVFTQPSAYFGSNFFNKISSKMQQAWHSFKSWWV